MDHSLHTLLIKEDRNAQKYLYFQHCDRLMSIIRRYLSNVHDAEEVLQDTFINIFDHIGNYDIEKGKFGAWSAKIAVNSSLIFLRKKRSVNISLDDVKEFEKKYQVELSNELWNEDWQLLLKKLTPNQALVFQLKAIEGYSYEEIKSILGLNDIANGRKLFSLARQGLRSMLHSKRPVLFLLFIQKFFEL